MEYNSEFPSSKTQNYCTSTYTKPTQKHRKREKLTPRNKNKNSFHKFIFYMVGTNYITFIFYISSTFYKENSEGVKRHNSKIAIHKLVS